MINITPRLENILHRRERVLCTSSHRCLKDFNWDRLVKHLHQLTVLISNLLSLFRAGWEPHLLLWYSVVRYGTLEDCETFHEFACWQNWDCETWISMSGLDLCSLRTFCVRLGQLCRFLPRCSLQLSELILSWFPLRKPKIVCVCVCVCTNYADYTNIGCQTKCLLISALPCWNSYINTPNRFLIFHSNQLHSSWSSDASRSFIAVSSWSSRSSWHSDHVCGLMLFSISMQRWQPFIPSLMRGLQHL